MKKLLLISLVAPMLFCSCSREVVVQKIINDSLQSVKKSQDFDRADLKQYKVQDAIIDPFFRNYGKDVYSLHFTALSRNIKLKTVKIISYELIIGEGEDKISLAKHVDTRMIFKPYRDEKTWGAGVLFAGITLFDKTQLEVDRSSKIKLILEVEIESSDAIEKKTIEYEMKYDEDRY